jgi:hypothetical protein
MMGLTLETVREMKRQLVSRSILPTGNPPVFWFQAEEMYPGQAYFWRTNENVRRAEVAHLIEKGLPE